LRGIRRAAQEQPGSGKDQAGPEPFFPNITGLNFKYSGHDVLVSFNLFAVGIPNLVFLLWYNITGEPG
jgi:hypothetical protein